MKRILVVGIVLFASCKTPSGKAETPAAAVRFDPFAVAEEWVLKGDHADEIASTLKGWSTPVVQRMHRANGAYIALVTGEGNAGLLLTIQQRDGKWVVVDANLDRADYLWPAQ